jgi:hypothetical protein|nr:hypothetical protein [Panacagrimonas sp.]
MRVRRSFRSQENLQDVERFALDFDHATVDVQPVAGFVEAHPSETPMARRTPNI